MRSNRPRRVIVADHEQGPQLAARIVLQRGGFTVSTADTAEDLLHLLKQPRDVEVILVDLRLPGLQIPDLEQRISAIRPAPSVIYLVRGASPPQHDAPSIGEVVSKPFSPRQLLIRVSETCFRASPDRHPPSTR